MYKGADQAFMDELKLELRKGDGVEPEELFEGSLQDMVERIMICKIDCATTFFDVYEQNEEE